MSLRILHVLDHSIPLHSGYTFRTLSILREQRLLGWETFHVTSPKHHVAEQDEETIEGWHFFRTRLQRSSLDRVVVARELRLMRAIERRLEDVERLHGPSTVRTQALAKRPPGSSAARMRWKSSQRG